jgi:hypothetical protein
MRGSVKEGRANKELRNNTELEGIPASENSNQEGRTGHACRVHDRFARGGEPKGK